MSISLISYVISIIITLTVSVLVTIMVEAFKKPYPVTRLDHFIRIPLKKGKIKGKNLKYSTNFEMGEESIQNVLDHLKSDGRNGEFYDLVNLNMNGVCIKNLNAVNNGFVGTIRVGDIEGRLEIVVYKQDSDFSPDENEDREVYLEFSVSYEDWKYKQVKDILYDTSLYKDHISKLLSKKYNLQANRTVVEFEIKEEPIILSYLNKNANLNNSIKIKLNNYVYAMFYEKRCKIIGVNTSSDISDILYAISWYV